MKYHDKIISSENLAQFKSDENLHTFIDKSSVYILRKQLQLSVKSLHLSYLVVLISLLSAITAVDLNWRVQHVLLKAMIIITFLEIAPIWNLKNIHRNLNKIYKA